MIGVLLVFRQRKNMARWRKGLHINIPLSGLNQNTNAQNVAEVCAEMKWLF